VPVAIIGRCVTGLGLPYLGAIVQEAAPPAQAPVSGA
jgi:hypothetical protein